jgi:hypothetical protein
LRRTGGRFFAIVTGRETIETIHDIPRKNFAATPTSSNAGQENRRDQRPLIPRFLPPRTSNDPDGMPPSGSLRFWGQPKRFSVLFLLPFTASDDAGDSSMLNSFALHIESLTNT